MSTAILALNSGSSSLKFGLYNVENARPDLIFSGEAEWQDEGGCFWAKDSKGGALGSQNAAVATQQDAVIRIGKLLDDAQIQLQSVGHRVVHGGPRCRKHCVIDPWVSAELELAAEFAPLHVPAALSLIRYATDHFR